MDEHTDYLAQLQTALLAKTEWYNTKEFPALLEKYRLLYTCEKNIYDNLLSKQIIAQDPYKLDRKISEIHVPDNSQYNENERNLIIGTRLSEYDTMLDFVCTYTRFSTETTTLPKIKKMQELNATFAWDQLSSNSSNPNTRGLALMINELKANAPQIVLSMVTDYTTKCAQYMGEINKKLNTLIRFQRELYKATIRKDLMEHPSFNREKAFESPENMLNEIKRIFADAMGKKTPFYTELINEIVAEETSPNKDTLRKNVLASLEIKEDGSSKGPKKKKVDTKAILINAVSVLGALAPTIHTLQSKIEENFELLQAGKKSGFAKLIELLKKAFHVQPKEVKFSITSVDPVTKHKVNRDIKMHELLDDMNKKERIYSGIAAGGAELAKISAANESQILTFLGKQISENQNLFNVLSSLDEYFKDTVPSQNRSRVKGMKIELDTMRNTIINANKKRGEYQAILEEAEQMRRLGISDDND